MSHHHPRLPPRQPPRYQVFPVLALLSSNAFYWSTLPALLRIKRARSGLGSYNAAIYPWTWASAVSWLTYGFLTGNPYLFFSAGPGTMVTLWGLFVTHAAADRAQQTRMEASVLFLAIVLASFGMAAAHEPRATGVLLFGILVGCLLLVSQPCRSIRRGPSHRPIPAGKYPVRHHPGGPPEHIGNGHPHSQRGEHLLSPGLCPDRRQCPLGRVWRGRLRVDGWESRGGVLLLRRDTTLTKGHAASPFPQAIRDALLAAPSFTGAGFGVLMVRWWSSSWARQVAYPAPHLVCCPFTAAGTQGRLPIWGARQLG